jgi:hypothetical protein
LAGLDGLEDSNKKMQLKMEEESENVKLGQKDEVVEIVYRSNATNLVGGGEDVIVVLGEVGIKFRKIEKKRGGGIMLVEYF